MFFSEKVLLSNKVEMPRLAFGTWQISPSDTFDCVSEAIKVGFRHFDTALSYGNEAAVGMAIRKSGIPREEFFVTTKVPAEVKSAEGADGAIRESLYNLDLGYIDLLLIHAPMPWEEIRGAKRYYKENLDVWGVMEKLYAGGSIRSLGVSNFQPSDVNNILKNCNDLPMVNQIKVHPGSSAAVTLRAAAEKGIVPMAYSPLGHGKALSNPYVVEMAERYGVSPARLCLRYTLQRGCCPVVKSTNPAHMADCGNLDFVISDDDMRFLSCLGTMKNLKKYSAK